MLKQFYKSLKNLNKSQRGMVLALTLFVVAAAAVIVLVGLSSIFNRVNLDKYGGLAENAARTCLSALDNRLGTAAIDPYTTCASGQAFVLDTGSGCVNDLSDDANTILNVGNNCDCAVFLDTVGVSQYAVYADGRCYTPGNNRKQPIVRRVLTANLDFGTAANCYDAVGDVSGLTAVATSTNSTVGLNWTAVENATDYQICRSTDAGTCNSTTTFTATFTTASNYYTDTNVPYGTYYYTVRATRCSGLSLSVNVSNQEDIAMECPLCKKYVDGSCVNQTSSEDIRNECNDTTGCLTGNCDGSGACGGSYNDTAQHNCAAGQNCSGGSCCTLQSACGGATGACSGQTITNCGVSVNCSTACTTCCKANNYCGSAALTGYVLWVGDNQWLCYNASSGSCGTHQPPNTVGTNSAAGCCQAKGLGYAVVTRLSGDCGYTSYGSADTDAHFGCYACQ